MKNRQVYIILIFLLSFSILGCNSKEDNLMTLSLQNPIALERLHQSVEIPLERVEAIHDQEFIIRDNATQKELPYQWLANGNLLIQADFQPEETKTITFYQGAPQEIEAGVYGRFVPERYEDFAWENDQVAYRMYGKALEEIPDQNAWGMDVWAKNTHKMIIDEWYEKDDYHRDHGEGLDFFNVGSTLGAGDVLPFLDDELTYLGNYTDYKILEEGPLRFSFELIYPEVEKEGKTIAVKKKIHLDKGDLLNEWEVSYQFEPTDSLPVYVGIAFNKNGKGRKIVHKNQNFTAFWPDDSQNGSIGTAVLFPDEKGAFKEVDGHLGKVISIQNGDPLQFYSGGAWSKAGEITSAQEWETYLEQEVKKINNLIKIK